MRRLDVFRDGISSAIQRSGRFQVRRNETVRLSTDAIRLIKKAKGSYLGLSLPSSPDCPIHTSLDLLLIDEREQWAGGFVFTFKRARSPRANRRIERDIRAAELVLRAHVRSAGWKSIGTVTVGIIADEPTSDFADDLIVSAKELEDRLGVSITDTEEAIDIHVL